MRAVRLLLSGGRAREDGGRGEAQGLGRLAGYADNSVHSRAHRMERGGVQRGIDGGELWREGRLSGRRSRIAAVGGRGLQEGRRVVVAEARQLSGLCVAASPPAFDHGVPAATCWPTRVPARYGYYEVAGLVAVHRDVISDMCSDYWSLCWAGALIWRYTSGDRGCCSDHLPGTRVPTPFWKRRGARDAM